MSKKVVSILFTLALLFCTNTSVKAHSSNEDIVENEHPVIFSDETDTSSIPPRYFVTTKSLFSFKFANLKDGSVVTTKSTDKYFYKKNLTSGVIGFNLDVEKNYPDTKVYIGVGSWNANQGYLDAATRYYATLIDNLYTSSATNLKSGIKYYGYITSYQKLFTDGKITVCDIL